MRIIAIILALQAVVFAAPSDITKELDPSTLTLADEHVSDSSHLNSEQSARQKRWFNYYGYGFPPVSPIVYPSNVKRDDSAATGVYGAQEDPFSQIYRRLQEIAGYARQPTYSAPTPQVPIFFPVIFIPQIGCRCESLSQPTTNSTDVNVENRFDDVRQNWGFVVNNTEPDRNDPDYVDDSIRPISFATIRPNRPSISNSIPSRPNRPPPPVEHGSSQAGIPRPDQGRPTVPPTFLTSSRAPFSASINPSTISPPSLSVPTATRPTACDTAILSCCHRLRVTHKCFTDQGCQDFVVAGEPCSINSVRNVIIRFQKLYDLRTSELK